MPPLLSNRAGAATIEYVLVVGLVAMLAIAALIMIGERDDSMLRQSVHVVNNATSIGPP